MPPEENKQNAEETNTPEPVIKTEPVPEPQVVIQPEPEIAVPTEAKIAPTPQPVEPLGETTPESEITPEIENTGQIEPISAESPNGVKPEEIPLEPTDLSPERSIASDGTGINPSSNGTSTTEPIKTEIKPIEPVPQAQPEIKTESEPIASNPAPAIISNKNKARELLVKARNAIQFRKRKKLDKVMTLFLKKSKITNDEVEKFLHVSDATATRYLSQLEKEGKIKQSEKTGHSVFLSLIHI